MSDDVLLAQFVEKQRAKLNRLRSQLLRESDTFREYLDIETALRVIDQSVRGVGGRGYAAKRGGRTQQSNAFISTTTEIMRSREGTPIRVSELHAELQAQGIDVNVRNLSSRLSSNDRFKSLGSAGWVLDEGGEEEGLFVSLEDPPFSSENGGPY